MDRLQPLRASGSDRGVSPVEVRRREVSDGFGAREGENKGETKGEIHKGKSCTEQENKNKQQNKVNKSKYFSKPDATTSPSIAEDKPAVRHQDPATLRATALANEQAKFNESKVDAECSLGQTADHTDATTATMTTMVRSLQPKPNHGQCSSAPPTANRNLDMSRATLRQFALTIVYSGQNGNIDRALAAVQKSSDRLIDRKLRSIEGANAKKKTKRLLEEYCATLRADALLVLEGEISESNAFWPEFGEQRSEYDCDEADPALDDGDLPENWRDLPGNVAESIGETADPTEPEDDTDDVAEDLGDFSANPTEAEVWEDWG